MAHNRDILCGKAIVVGVCGGIAAYKTCGLVSLLKKSGADVHVVMTHNATQFVSPLTFETLSKNKVTVDTFAKRDTFDPRHISLAGLADAFVIAPATANFIAKYANGIADDFLSTTVLAVRAPVLVAPSMNTAMLTHPATADNIAVLRRRGVFFIEPDEGALACGEGKGRLPEPEAILSAVCALPFAAATVPKPCGKTFLITAGGTREDIDRVRFIGNYSSGKTGIALCNAALERGAEVILVHSDSVDVSALNPAVKAVCVRTTREMYDAVTANLASADIVIKAAAPADYRPAEASPQKLKGSELTLRLVKNPDIAKAVGQAKGSKKLVIFCAETHDLKAAARAKLADKNADMVVANDISREGAGFSVDTNIVTIIGRGGAEEDLPLMTKNALARIIIDKSLKL